MRRPPLFGGGAAKARSPPGLAEIASGDGGSSPITVSPFQDAAAAAAAAGGLDGAAAAQQRRGGASNPAALARALSSMAAAALEDLSYLADPVSCVDGSVDAGDQAAAGGEVTSPKVGAATTFAPFQTAAATAAALPPSVKASYPREKAVFTLSMLVIVLQAFWLGAAPLTVYRLCVLWREGGREGVERALSNPRLPLRTNKHSLTRPHPQTQVHGRSAVFTAVPFPHVSA